MKWLRRILPAPLTSALLLALWLVLARSATVGQVLLGLTMAIGIPILTSNLRPARGPLRHPLVAARYIFRVSADVLISNFEVARDLLRWRWHQPIAKFVTIPLELRDPSGLAVLAMVTTVVPGTVWSELALDHSALRLHVWDVPDEAAFIVRFKARYEAPLREIFE